MSTSKSVAWFAEDEKPNRFFFRSIFRSWKFLINAGLLAGIGLALVWILSKHIDKLNHSSLGLALLGMFIQFVAYPFVRAVLRHKKINDLYEGGFITEPAAGCPLDEVFRVADNAMNEGLRNAMGVFALFLLSLVLWKLS
jgi:hypothetical protein